MTSSYRSIWLIPVICLFGVLLESCKDSASSSMAQTIPEKVDFNWHIRPILSDRCYTCHGPDENVREANLRLDIQEGAFAPLEDQADQFALVPGDIENSHLIKRIRTNNPETIMPPPSSNLSLSEYEIELLTKWVEQGAEWKTHWAFEAPQKVKIPKNLGSWAKNEIDYFAEKAMSSQGLSPSQPATKSKLLRRLSFDLTGLPTDLEEIAAFEEDDSDEAWERQIDRLLASQAYGERMASIWLDAARYADSHGYQDDRPRTMWPWRDWVIQAYNTNMLYDSFLIKQIAGDLLESPSYDDRLATGFNRNHAITQEGGVVNEEYVTEYVADRMQTFSTAFLGLTIECARCHDHKYDPISQKDYYSLFAFFNTLDERGQVNYFDLSPKPHMKMQDAEYEAYLESIDSITTSWETELNQIEKSSNEAFHAWLSKEKTPTPTFDDVSKSLVGHFNLDRLTGFSTENLANSSLPAKMNTGLIGEVTEPIHVEGYKGKGLKFDGENFLNLGDISDKEYYHHFSYATWIKSTQKQKKDAGLLVKRNGEQKRGGHQLLLSKDGKLKVSLIHAVYDNAKIEVESKNKIPLNTWNHVAMTYDGSGKAAGISLYINGKLQPQKVLHDKLNERSILNGNDLLAGNWSHRKRTINELQGFVGGIMDEIQVYDKTLSPLEIKVLAESKHTSTNQELFKHYLWEESKAYQKVLSQLDSIRPHHNEIPYVMIMEEMDSARATFVLDRGVYDAPTERVFPNTPAQLIDYPAEFPQNRLGLAKWMLDPKHPLTARVAVNRIWQMLFGRGIVNTPEDFGSQGALPSHPELLDWLAVDFQENGWDIKRLIKMIVSSATYQQSSDMDPEKRRRDVDNVYLARGPVNRLSSEMIRDNALAISGLLDTKVGGPWVKPYQPAGVWKELANQIGENKYRASTGTDLYRRSLYAYWKRTIPPPSMLTFDAAERTVCVVKRQSTSTPLQSLVLLNDPQYVEASRLLAARILMTPDTDLEEQLRIGFKLATSRSPKSKELDVMVSLFEQELQRFQKEKSSAKAYLEVGEFRLADEVDQPSLAAMTVIANMLLNLDESKMKS